MAPDTGSAVIITVFIGIFSYLLLSAIYNLYFHPLTSFPGSATWKVSRLPFIRALLSGNLPHQVKKLHDIHGDIVRVAPDELSFIDPRAWKDIYLDKAFLRPQVWGSRPPGVEAHNFVSAPVVDHTRFRKAVQSAFSERATKDHEPTVQRYVDLLMSRLKEITKTPESDGKHATVDLVQWFNFTTFDIIGDLGWGSSFGCLEQNVYHPWIKIVLHFKAVLAATAVAHFPVLNNLLMKITPASAMADLHFAMSTAHEKVKDRLSRPAETSDLMTHILEHNKSFPESSLSVGEIEANSMAIVVAGSDTLTTALTGAIHQLLKNPACFATLLKEIRTSFASESDITSASTASLSYLKPVLNETLRLCPPFPDGLRREVPKGGATIAGYFIPEGITVSVACWSAFTSSSHFADPDSFIPERWLPGSHDGSSVYAKDDKSVFQPFSVGPHNCLGQPLAWMEMRLILARLLWSFDIRLADESRMPEWAEQKIYWLWEKQPLEVELVLRS